MSTNLAFGSNVLADVSAEDYYAKVNNKPEQANLRDIPLPNTAGMRGRVHGRGSSKETANTLEFLIHRNFDTKAAAESWINAMESLQSNHSTMFQTLHYDQPRFDSDDKPIPNARMMNFQTVPPFINPTFQAFKNKFEVSAKAIFIKY